MMGVSVTNKTTGYSGNSAIKKLGIKTGFNIKLINPPAYYFSLFTGMPDNLNFDCKKDLKLNIIHFFIKSREEYVSQLPLLKELLESDGMIWASWPKKSSGVLSDVNEEVIRNYAIGIGLVDIKVCAVDEIWSGLKLVIPVKDRLAKQLLR